ncbi:hypothetical protein [Streptomyces kurssanovii]|uniref:DUF3558 domain-containing protein n=1 Tax=Streptomyces kurssanovii TaxID=67312 RepID=A0ABV3HUK1_9ACTN
MHRNSTRAAALISALVLTAAACSDGDSAAVPELPERICWGVFTAGDITPLMPTGKKAAMFSDPFIFDDDRTDSATCNVDIDGRNGMGVRATRLDFERQVDWSSWDVAKPKPIGVGERGIIWSSGAGTHIVCEPSKSPSDPGKYVQLYVSTDRSPDKEELRAALPGLLQKMVTFTQRELNCP